MREAKRFKQPISEVGRLTLELFGYCLAFPLALFVVTGCATPANRVRINQVQVIGTHNSYHLRSHESLRTLMAKRAPDLAPGLDYSHRPLAEQFSRLGIRQIELDCFADPDGGLFAEPRGPKVAAALGLPPVPDHDPEHRLRAPGFKVMHMQDIDYFLSVLTLKEGLQQVRAWSGQHPRHFPVFILLELKEDQPAPELTRPVPFGERELEALEAEILSVFSREKILVPDCGELPFKQRLAVQTIHGSGFASGNSQGWRVEGLGRPLSPRACRRIALGVHAPRCRTF